MTKKSTLAKSLLACMAVSSAHAVSLKINNGNPIVLDRQVDYLAANQLLRIPMPMQGPVVLCADLATSATGTPVDMINPNGQQSKYNYTEFSGFDSIEYLADSTVVELRHQNLECISFDANSTTVIGPWVPPAAAPVITLNGQDAGATTSLNVVVGGSTNLTPGVQSTQLPVSWTISVQPSKGTASIDSASGLLQYTAPTSLNTLPDTDTLEITVTDNAQQTDSLTVNINILDSDTVFANEFETPSNKSLSTTKVAHTGKAIGAFQTDAAISASTCTTNGAWDRPADGQSFCYRITVSNNGTQDLSNVHIRELFPLDSSTNQSNGYSIFGDIAEDSTHPLTCTLNNTACTGTIDRWATVIASLPAGQSVTLERIRTIHIPQTTQDDLVFYAAVFVAGDEDTSNNAIRAVVSQNQPPTIADPDQNADGITSVVLDEDGSPNAFNLQPLSASDPNNDGLIWSIATPPANGSASVDTSGTVSYTPTTDYNGSDSFIVQVTDGFGGMDQLVVNTTIHPVNDPPQLALAQSALSFGIIDIGAQTVNGLIQQASPGPQNESNQTLAWQASVSGGNTPAVIDTNNAPPAVSNNALSLTLLGEPGSAALDIQVTDDGQSFNHISGQLETDSQSTSQPLAINVLQCASLPDASMGWWPAQETLARKSNLTSIVSSLGLSNWLTGINGTANNIGFVRGKIGQAWQFASSSQLTLPATDIDFSADFTLGFWYRVDQVPASTQSLLTIGDINSDYLQLRLNTDSTLSVEIGTVSRTTQQGLTHPSVLPQGQWVYVAMSRNMTTGEFSLIVDENGSITSSTMTYRQYPSGDLVLGQDPRGALTGFNGMVDELLFIKQAVNTANTGTELPILQAFDSTTLGFCFSNLHLCPDDGNGACGAASLNEQQDGNSPGDYLQTHTLLLKAEDGWEWNQSIDLYIVTNDSNDTLQLDDLLIDGVSVWNDTSIELNTPGYKSWRHTIGNPNCGTTTGCSVQLVTRSTGEPFSPVKGVHVYLQKVADYQHNLGGNPEHNAYHLGAADPADGNSAPIIVDAANIPYADNLGLNVNAGESQTLQLYANDADADSLTWNISVQPLNGSAGVDPTTGLVTYSPNVGFSGNDSFTVQVADGKGGQDSLTFTVLVNAVPVINDPDGIDDGQYDPTINQGSGNFNITLTATDADQDVLTWAVLDANGTPIAATTDANGNQVSVLTTASNGTVTVQVDTGEVTYSPDINFIGSESFTVQVVDGKGGADTLIINITVQ